MIKMANTSTPNSLDRRAFLGVLGKAACAGLAGAVLGCDAIKEQFRGPTPGEALVSGHKDGFYELLDMAWQNRIGDSYRHIGGTPREKEKIFDCVRGYAKAFHKKEKGCEDAIFYFLPREEDEGLWNIIEMEYLSQNEEGNMMREFIYLVQDDKGLVWFPKYIKPTDANHIEYVTQLDRVKSKWATTALERYEYELSKNPLLKNEQSETRGEAIDKFYRQGYKKTGLRHPEWVLGKDMPEIFRDEALDM